MSGGGGAKGSASTAARALRWSVRGGAAALFVAWVWSEATHPDLNPPLPPERPFDPEVSALLDDLQIDDAVGDLRVSRILGPKAGTARVELRGGEEGNTFFSVGIEKSGHQPSHQPAAHTDLYDLSFGWGRGADPKTSWADKVKAATDAMVTRIKRREHEVPMPKGLDVPPAPAPSSSAAPARSR